MPRRSLIVTVCIAAASLAALAADNPRNKKPAPAQTSADASLQLASLAWMEGVWVRRQGTDLLEETWFAPQGDSMVGMFRWIKDGKLWMVEMMTITIDDGELVFRLRHFDRKQTPWEEKNSPMTCKLKSIAEREVAFERVDGEKAGSGYVISSSGPDAYEVALLPPQAENEAPPRKNGNPRKFAFTRKNH